VRILKGDLIQLALSGEFDVIVHGCNCQCTMGAGIAKSIKSKFPEAYKADRGTPKGDKSKLGRFSWAKIKRGAVEFVVVNAYTQFHWRDAPVLVDYEAIRQVMKAVKAQFHTRSIAYPKIGAGLAGGSWEIIEQIIDEELQGEDHTLVVL
jgi:O-acetyl-ADP-ribose deacetylase (regulator of RNase III)